MKHLKLIFACLLTAIFSIGQVWADNATYSVTSTSAVSVSGAPSEATASYSSTYTAKEQLTAGNSMTLTLSGYAGYKITGITLSMKSNSSKGAGSFSAVAGTTTIASISDAKFNDASWYGAWSTSYVNVVPAMTDDDYEIQENEDVVLTISASANSIYCNSFIITYEDASSTCETLAAPTNPSATPAQTSVELNWDAVTNASGYKVVFNGTDYDIASGTTSKTIEGLAMETEYHWTVAAKGDGTTYCAAGTPTAQQSVTTLDACTANKAIYTVASKTSVTPSGALEGSTVTFSNNGTNSNDQMTSGKSMTLTLSGYDGATIKGLTLSMHSNASAGAGTFSLTIGSTTVAEISTATNFNKWFDNTAYGNTYRNVHVPFAEDVVVGTGEDIVVIIAATTNSLFCQSFSFCYEEPAAAPVEKPTFSVAGGSYLEAQSVEISCATVGADIYYTLDGNDPTSASTHYSGTAIDISETKTLKAIAIKGSDESAIASATYTIETLDHEGTLADPYSVADARKVIDVLGGKDNVYAAGIVSTANLNQDNIDQNHYASYWISDDGTTAIQLEAYHGRYINDADVTSVTDILVGDEVVIYGNLTKYNSTYEFAEGNYLISLDRTKAPADLAYAETTIEKNIGDATFTNTLTNPNGLDVTYTSSSEAVATVDPDGLVTIVGMGTTTIKASFAGNAVYVAGDASYTLRVEDPSLTKVTFDATLASDIAEDNEEGVTKSGVNIKTTHTDGVNDQSAAIAYYQTFKNATLTVTSTAGNIKRIEFETTGGASYAASGFAGVTNNVWTGDASDVVLTASGNQVRISKLIVYYKLDTRDDPGISWDPESAELTLTDYMTPADYPKPELIIQADLGDNPLDFITLSSDNESLATINKTNDGQINISWKPDVTGIVHFTATFEGNETYKPATAVSTIKVNPEVSPWAYVYTSNVDISSNENKKVIIAETEYNAVKANSGQTATITLPQSTSTIHLHLVAWNTEAQTVTVTGACFDDPIELAISADAGVKSTGNYTLEGNAYEYYFSLTPDNAVAADEEITITAASGKRFVLFGVNQEGGVLPVLESIEISGDLATKTGYKAGDALDLDGLTVEATYSLGGVAQTPVDITNDPELELTYDPLVENQTEVTIMASFKGQTDDITITGLEVASADPKIYVDKLNVNFASVEVGDAVPAAQTITVTLTNVASVTAALGGTNPEAFSISKTEGIVSGDEITISVLASTAASASYSATIAISDGAEGATDKTVNLSFAVTAPASDDDVSGTWTLVTNTTTLAAGKKVIIAQYVDADGAINTMAGQASNNRSVIASSVAGTTLTPTVGTKVMTLADAGSGHFYLKTSDGEYLYNASTSSKSYLRTKAEEENVSWTIAVDAEGVATITSVENTNRTKMRYNPNTSGTPLFNCYASGQNDIALYMHEDAPEPPTPVYTEVRTGLEPNHYYTICYPNAMTSIEGATLWSFIGKDANFAYLVQESAPFEAGKPFIMYATASTVQAVLGDETDAPGANGAIHGTFSNLGQEQLNDLATVAGSDLYLVIGDELRRATGYDKDGITPLTGNSLPAQRAFVVVDEITGPAPAPGRNVRSMPLQGESAQGVENIEASEKPMKMMIDGQLFIIRGEKMYDATGRLVK